MDVEMNSSTSGLMDGLFIRVLVVGIKGVGSNLRALNKVLRAWLCFGHTVRTWSTVSSVPHEGQRGEMRGLIRCLEVLVSFWVKEHRM